MANIDKIQFEHKGIGEVLNQNSLEVPPNQREYSWETEHIKELFDDYIKALDEKGGIHFLGTIVLTKIKENSAEVSDGQQRLATTIILLAAIRDFFSQTGNNRAGTVESKYLFENDLETDVVIPRLRLNSNDHSFFVNYVLRSRNWTDRKKWKSDSESHRKIMDAVKQAEIFVAKITNGLDDEDKIKRLTALSKFIDFGAQVIVLRVPDNMDAFSMFETLNDRGLKASQADLVKNYLLGKADSRISEAQQFWARMIGRLEATGIEEVTVVYLYHFLLTKHIFIRPNEVLKTIKDNYGSQHKSLEFLEDLSETAADYAALFNGDSQKWSNYDKRVPEYLRTINEDLRVAQIRPLMLSVAKHFTPKEANRAFRYFVYWSVRFLITHRQGGILEHNYADRAHDVGTGKIKTANQLAKVLEDVIPNDTVFGREFETASVSYPRLARYYLHTLERKRMRKSEPEHVTNRDEGSINLEHILPERSQENWTVDPDIAKAYYKRIGNMALLQVTINSKAGNLNFESKKPFYQSSNFALTTEIAKYESWGSEQIDKRQKEMALLAVKAWPITD